jgi:hypothetical protein
MRCGAELHVNSRSAANTFKNEQLKFSALFSRFTGTSYTGIQQHQPDEMHR